MTKLTVYSATTQYLIAWYIQQFLDKMKASAVRAPSFLQFGIFGITRYFAAAPKYERLKNTKKLTETKQGSVDFISDFTFVC